MCACRYISLLRLLRLGRAYRLFNWVALLTYNQTLSLMAVTLVRNFVVSGLVLRWMQQPHSTVPGVRFESQEFPSVGTVPWL